MPDTPPTPEPPAPKNVFTTPGRIAILVALIGIVAAMRWVITTDAIGTTGKTLAGGGVLLLGCLAIIAGMHFWTGRHRR